MDRGADLDADRPAPIGSAALCVGICVALAGVTIATGALAWLRAAIAPSSALDNGLLVIVAVFGGFLVAQGWRRGTRTVPQRRPFERRGLSLPDGTDPYFVAAIGLPTSPTYGQRRTRLLRERIEAAHPAYRLDQLGAHRLGMVFAAADQQAAVLVIDVVRHDIDAALELLDRGTTHTRSTPGAVTIGLACSAATRDLRGVTAAALVALDTAERAGLALAIDDPADVRRAAERQALMRDLTASIEADALTLAYQPKLCARTGEIDSLEALARWDHPVRGPVTPGYFVPIAEELGQVRALTEWVVGRALSDAARFAAAGVARRIYVNVSAGLVGDPAFAAWLLDRIAPHAEAIGIEITETAVLSDPERALAHLDALAAAGISIAIDDYGAGLSSLAYLKKLPATELKVDMMFIRDLTASNRDPMIVRSTIDLAHGLGLRVTAEGVDKPETLALLRVMGCDLLQGYHIARPMTAAALIDYLQEYDPAKADMHQSIGLLMMNAAA